MKKPILNCKLCRALRGGAGGFSLIEVVIAIALMGIIAIAILSALTTASLALIVADTRATAESLARSQMEDVKMQDYIDYSKNLTQRNPPSYRKIQIPSGIGTYTLEIKVEPFNPVTGVFYAKVTGQEDVFVGDDGIQRITVTVTYYTIGGGNRRVEQKYTLVDYKRDPQA